MTNDEQKTSPNATPSPMVKKRYRADRDAIDRKRLPLTVKVFGVLCLVAGGATAVLLTITIVTMVLAFTSGNLDIEASTATMVIFVAETVLYTALATMFAIFGIRLLRNKRKHAAHGTEAMIFILAAIIICSIMLNGLGIVLSPADNQGYLPGMNAGAFNLGAGLSFAILFAVSTAASPSAGIFAGAVILLLAAATSTLIPAPARTEDSN